MQQMPRWEVPGTTKEKIKVVLFSLKERERGLGKELGDGRISFPRDVVSTHLEQNWKAMFGSVPFSQQLMLSMKATMSQKFQKGGDGGAMLMLNEPCMASEDVAIVKSGTFERKPEYDIKEDGSPAPVGSCGAFKVDFSSLARGSISGKKPSGAAAGTPDVGIKRKRGFGGPYSKSAKINSLEFRKSLPRPGVPSSPMASPSPAPISRPPPPGASTASESQNASAEQSPKQAAKAASEDSPSKRPRLDPPSEKPTEKPSEKPAEKTPKPAPQALSKTPAPPAPKAPAESVAKKGSQSSDDNAILESLRKELKEQHTFFMNEIDELKKTVLDLKAANDGLEAKVAKLSSQSSNSADGASATAPRRWTGISSDSGTDSIEAWPVVLSSAENQTYSAILRERNNAVMMSEEAKEFAEATLNRAVEIAAARDQMEEALKKAEKERDAAIAGRLKEEEENTKLKSKIKVMTQIIRNMKSSTTGQTSNSVTSNGTTTTRFEYKPKNPPVLAD
ncbi:hypothetical protein HDU96_009046 [Phlyctochytrium bullatum]|nr:hypothetical protein HDU96_009046 [Phlyctochytrium bullatum]